MTPPKTFPRKDLTDESWLDFGSIPPKLFPSHEAFGELWDLHPDTHHEVMIRGTPTPIPRYQQAYLRDYRFTGSTSKADPEVPESLVPYLKWANALGYGEFNQLLVNWYEDGNNYIGPHADDTRPLVKDSPIITITLCDKGLPRKFRVRKDKEIVLDYDTLNGAVLVMGGKFQKELKHEIVKINGKKAEQAGRRISVTLRQFA